MANHLIIGLGGTGALAATVLWGISSARAPVVAAHTALQAWIDAASAAAGANSGALQAAWHWLVGGGETAGAASASVTAIGAGVSALVSVGTSLVVTLVAEKLIKIGLDKINVERIPGVVETTLSEMETHMNASRKSRRSMT